VITSDWLEALVLGLVQGLTEFLPISSDGHLSISQKLFDAALGRASDGQRNLFIIVVLHLGTLAAILVHYRAVGRTGAQGLLGSTAVPPLYRRSAVIRTGLLAIVATLPAIPVGLLLKKQLEAAFESQVAAGVGFLVTAVVLFLTTRLKGGEKGPAETTFLDAFLIGVAQSFAPLPGVSRSGLTIASALGLGLSRSWAVGFSLLMAIPAICGGAMLELKDVEASMITPEKLGPILAGTVLAGLVGYGAIIWLVKVVRSGRIWYFSVYLVVLASAVLGNAIWRGNRTDADPPTAKALDRPGRVGAP